MYICVNTVTNSVPLELLDIICNLCYCFKIETCIIGDICEYICEHSHELNLTWATWYLSPVTYVTVLRSKPVTQVTYVNIHVNTNYICEYTCEYSHELNPIVTNSIPLELLDITCNLYVNIVTNSIPLDISLDITCNLWYRSYRAVQVGLSSWLYSHVYSHM